MYFVDKEVLQDRLNYIDSLADQLESAEGFKLERISQMLVEAVVDVGNMIIDGFILRDPGSYQDVIDILENESAISPEDNAHFTETFKWRKELTRNYTNINHQQLKDDFLLHLSAYQNFKESIHRFFINEGQAVTAFKGDEENV